MSRRKMFLILMEMLNISEDAAIQLFHEPSIGFLDQPDDVQLRWIERATQHIPQPVLDYPQEKYDPHGEYETF